MTDVCREMGVRTDIPFKDLTDQEKEIVYHGPAEKEHIFYKAKNTNQSGELDFTYFNARRYKFIFSPQLFLRLIEQRGLPHRVHQVCASYMPNRFAAVPDAQAAKALLQFSLIFPG